MALTRIPVFHSGRAHRRFPAAIGLGAVVLLLSISSLTAEDVLTESRSTLEKWVETRQLISRTRSDWQADKDLLEQTVALYERELKSLEDQISGISTNSTQVNREMEEAEASKAASTAGLARVRAFAEAFDAAVKEQGARFPTPLQDILKPALARIPSDPANTKMPAAERIQVAVSLLNDIDKFQSAVNVFSEKRRNEQGEEVAVQTLYVGLGAAYFVNDTADFAGIGTAGPDGWLWTVRADIGPRVLEAVKMYRNERTAQFVPLPLTLN